MAKPSREYAFTITLLPRLYKMDADAQYDLTHLPVAKMLLAFGPITQLGLTLIAELTKQFNIHYHGVFRVNTQYDVLYPDKRLRKQFVDHFRKHALFGFVNISLVKDLTVWTDYIKKEIPDTKLLIGRCPVVFDSHKLLRQDQLDIEGYLADLIDEQ